MYSKNQPDHTYCHIYAQLDQVGNRLPEVLGHMQSLDLCCDASISFGQAEKFQPELAGLQQRGGLISPNIYPAMLDPSCHDPNWWRYSEAECVRLLTLAKLKFEALDLGPMLAVNTYTPGNTFVAACRKTGVRFITGFCAPIIIEDGDWRISHYGSPLSPYFIGDEDFRKPENPGTNPNPVMMVSMELRNPMTCLKHWSEGPWCPLNAQAADRWLEPGEDPLPFIAVANDWINSDRISGRQSFFHINLQYFFAGKCYDHNRVALEWLAEQRDLKRLTVGNIRDWAARSLESGGFRRQTTYLRGEMMGFHVGHRPGSIPDVIVDENLDGQTIWEYPNALPERYYDYQQKWDYPMFQPDGQAPASRTFNEISVAVELLSEDGFSRHLKVELCNAAESARISVALWNVLGTLTGPFEALFDDVAADIVVVPHPAGVGGTVIMTVECLPGKSTFNLCVKGCGRNTVSVFKRSWGGLLEAQTFEFKSKPYTVLVSQTPEPFTLQAAIKDGTDKSVTMERLCGIDYSRTTVLRGQSFTVAFEPLRLSCWYRFSGITADELELSGVEQVEAELTRRTADVFQKYQVTAKTPVTYQRFGDISEPANWCHAIAAKAAAHEMAAMNKWMKTLCCHNETVVVEAHPGITIPRGSITKALGHKFDVIKVAAGYDFRELCADYPQSWDWGVSGWVQWSELRLQIDGLNNAGSAYHLYLHAFDPEGRKASQSVILFNAAPGMKEMQQCVVADWLLPEGLDGRWQSTALCRIPVPAECLAWESLGIWIKPGYKTKLHDWIAQQGAPGMFCHLWLTKA